MKDLQEEIRVGLFFFVRIKLARCILYLRHGQAALSAKLPEEEMFIHKKKTIPLSPSYT